MTPTNTNVGRTMRRPLSHLIIWSAAIGLLGATAWVGVQTSLVPKTPRQAIAAAAALSSIFALGVAGLALARERPARLRVSGLAAIVLSVASLFGALQGASQLFVIGACNFAFAAWLWVRRGHLRSEQRGPWAQGDVSE